METSRHNHSGDSYCCACFYGGQMADSEGSHDPGGTDRCGYDRAPDRGGDTDRAYDRGGDTERGTDRKPERSTHADCGADRSTCTDG